MTLIQRNTIARLAIATTVVAINTSLITTTHAQQCADPDGDGWGWTGHNSCLAQLATDNNDDILALCVDEDGDGWGWTGKVSCWLGDARQFPNSPQCIDTDNDSWGWNGSSSCRVDNLNYDQATTNAGTLTGTTDNRVSSASMTPVGVNFNYATLRREGHRGDNWCLTWAADDSQITSLDDGDWLNTQTRYHNMLYRINGGSANASINELSGYPAFLRSDDGWYGYGVLSVNGVLYSMVSKARGSDWDDGPFNGVKMLRSFDGGNNWSRVDRNGNERTLSRYDSARNDSAASEMFFSRESARTNNGREGYPFSYVSFVQNGKDNQASKDGYVYIYSPEGAKAHELLLARAPADQLGNRNTWQYFAGWNGNQPLWSGNLDQRQPNMYLPQQNNRGEYFGWYSWLPSVVWNEGLQLYIMANGGTYAGTGLTDSTYDYYSKWMHEKSGSLGLWYSQTPYGPWQQFYYNEEWTVDNGANRTYQPKLSPKWISDDGKTMVLIWSDAMRNEYGQSHSVNYKWNQMEIQIQTQ